MNIHEFQAKRILAEAGVPVDHGRVASTPEDARAAAEEIPAARWVVKAQIHSGGRGKAGGIRLADTPADVEAAARDLLGSRLVTAQTGTAGRIVRRVLVAEAVELAGESYLAALVDRAARRPVVIASTEGGMEIEQVARTSPAKIFRETIDPAIGLHPFQVRRIARRLALDPGPAAALPATVAGILRILAEQDASLVEINPLASTGDGRLLAVDAKITFDDNALFRHEAIAALRDPAEEDPKEAAAAEHKLSYIRLDGTIGCMVNGAGLAMATMDIIKLAGGEPANFLDVGGGAKAENVENAFRIILMDPNVKGILVNIFGGIVRCDEVATGIIEAARAVEINVPVVIRLEGTNAEVAAKMLAESDIDFSVAIGFKDAAEKVAAALR